MSKPQAMGPRFIRARGGNVAMLWALFVIPILGVVGMAVDLNRSKNAHLHVQDSLDAAVLAAAKLMQTKGDSTDVDQQVADMFKADMKEIGLELTCEDPVSTKNVSDRTLSATVACDLETKIMPIFGTDDLKFSRTSKAAYSINKLEVSFMFDVSGSMKGQKLADLKASAKNALDILFDLPSAATGDLRVGVVPFATSVNAGTYFQEATNLSNPRSGKHDTNPNDGKSADMVTTSATCVTERKGSHAYSEEPPSSGRYFGAENDICPSTAILPLTNKRADIDARIASLVADGLTAGHIGIGWTWYELSPEWNAFWPTASRPMAYDTPALSKVAILMTDGEFNSAYEKGNGSTQDQALKICAGMKAQGIQVFAVVFQAPAAAKDLMTTCASAGSFYAAENASDLDKAYKAIAVRISRLRIAS